MKLTIDARDLEKLVKAVERLQKQVPIAIAQGLNEGGDKVRTQTQRALKTQTGVLRYASVTSRVRTARAFPTEGGASYSIFVNARPTKPLEFKTKVTRGRGGGVTIWMWGKAHKFKRSFQGTGKIGGQLKMRIEGSRTPLRSFDGPNMAKEAEKGQSAEAFVKTAEAAVPDDVVKRLARIL